MQFLYWKQDVYIGNETFRLETRVVDWKQDF